MFSDYIKLLGTGNSEIIQKELEMDLELLGRKLP